MSASTLRRVAVTLAAYALAAAVGWAAVGPVRRAFLLPDLFETLARGALLLGLPLAGLLAWRYPELARGGEGGEGEAPTDPPSEEAS